MEDVDLAVELGRIYRGDASELPPQNAQAEQKISQIKIYQADITHNVIQDSMLTKL